MQWKKAPTWDEIGWHNFFTLRPITIEKTVYCFTFVQRRRDYYSDSKWLYWHPGKNNRPLTYREREIERSRKFQDEMEQMYSFTQRVVESKSKILDKDEIEEFLNQS